MKNDIIEEYKYWFDTSPYINAPLIITSYPNKDDVILRVSGTTARHILAICHNSIDIPNNIFELQIKDIIILSRYNIKLFPNKKYYMKIDYNLCSSI